MFKTTLTLFYATLLQLLLFSDNSFAQKTMYARVEFAATRSQLHDLAARGLDIEHLGKLPNGRYTSDFSTTEQLILKEIARDVVVKNKDISKFYAEQNTKKTHNTARLATFPRGFDYGSMGGYMTFSEYVVAIDSLHTLYPNIVSAKYSIGTTYEGRPIYTFKISDNVAIDEPEPEALFTSLIHAREPLSAMQLWYYLCDLLQRYSQNDPEAQFIINHRELYFLPVWNPDGYVYNQFTNPQGGGLWRKNRFPNLDGSFGVDLNRNFEAGFGFDDIGSSPLPQATTYRGTAPFSENESAAMRDWANSRQFKTAFNHHSYSNVLIRPIGYDETLPCADEDAYNEYGALLTLENNYIFGKCSEVLGYNVNGVTDDWFYLEQTTKPKTMAFTPETGSQSVGFWPPQDSIIPYCELMQPANNKLAWLAGEYFVGEALATNDVYSTTIKVPFSFRNIGQTASIPLTATVVSNNLFFLNSNTKNYNSVQSFETKNDTLTFYCQVNTPNNTVISAKVRLNIDGFTQDFPFLVRYHLVNTENSAFESNIAVSPNPAHDILTIKANEGKTSFSTISLQNTLGQTVLTQKTMSDSPQISVAYLPKGVYFLQFFDSKNLFLGVKKIVLE